jgi:hypothetical protein
MLERHLTQAEEHVALGEHRQRELVARWRGTATKARRLLATFEEMQERHHADRDRIWNELAQNS